MNAVFLHLDDTLREQGAERRFGVEAAEGDEDGLLGRRRHGEALNSGSRGALEAALARNVYGAGKSPSPNRD